jgi:predicted nucleic acid-binding protein
VTTFVDTSVWYAAADRSDSSNARAKDVLRSLEERVTTDHVLLETWLLARHRLGRATAETIVTGIARGIARIEVTGAADLERAFAIGEEWPDQDFALTDRTSFAVMERLGLSRVASFDDDFAVFRTGGTRATAFEVIR